MTTIEILDTLIKEAEQLEASKQVDISIQAKIPHTTVDDAKYKDWQARIDKFLTDNNWKGFIEDPAFTVHGNWYLFDPQFKKIKMLKELNDFLDTKLNFQTDDIREYLLRIFATNDIRMLEEMIDSLDMVIGKDDVNEILRKIQADGLLNMNISNCFGGNRIFQIHGEKFLTIAGRKAFQEIKEKHETVNVHDSNQPTIVKQKTVEVINNNKASSIFNMKNIKWLIGLIVAGGVVLTIYFVSVKTENKVTSYALHNAVIQNSNITINQSNEVKTDTQVTK